MRLELAPIGLHGSFDEMTVRPRPASPGQPTNVETDHPPEGAHSHAVQLCRPTAADAPCGHCQYAVQRPAPQTDSGCRGQGAGAPVVDDAASGAGVGVGGGVRGAFVRCGVGVGVGTGGVWVGFGGVEWVGCGVGCSVGDGVGVPGAVVPVGSGDDGPGSAHAETFPAAAAATAPRRATAQPAGSTVRGPAWAGRPARSPWRSAPGCWCRPLRSLRGSANPRPGRRDPVTRTAPLTRWGRWPGRPGHRPGPSSRRQRATHRLRRRPPAGRRSSRYHGAGHCGAGPLLP